MAERQLTGTRIRERRIDVGLRQSALAEAVGISGSYLNLIEHNRRRIGGRLLNDIARALDVDPAQLTSGAESAVLDQLRVAASADPGAGAELARIEEFAGRFPGWAKMVTGQARKLAALEARVSALTDRLAHDPQLASSLHDVLSAATAIRSTSSILVSGEAVDQDWQDRFHRNIHDDSRRLAEASRALVTYLDAPEPDATPVLSPSEEAEAWLLRNPEALARIEEGERPDDVMDRAAPFHGAAGLHLRRELQRRATDARSLPLDVLGQVAREQGHDPALIAARLGLPFGLVLRRLAALRPEDGHPAAGLVIADATGAILMQQPVGGLTLPRGGAACPLWPMFRALAAPGQPLRDSLILPGDPAPRFLAYAVAEPAGAPGFDLPARFETVMLVFPGQAGTTPPIPAGVACRICPRTDCAARRDASVLGDIH
ncbi:helix-turn-helix domain-containing protein [Marivivens marinus]|uniref:helix-turn-helix domain-containing protein n=1 Tax=Marivivens marinus TaxID=3110173 RepID=UPI003B84B705